MKPLTGAALTLACCFCYSTNALPGPPPACETPLQTTRSLQSRLDGVHIMTLSGPRVQRFLQAFNAQPPVSDFAADNLLIARSPGKKAVLLVMYENGCLKHRGAISRELYRRVWRASHDTGRHI